MDSENVIKQLMEKSRIFNDIERTEMLTFLKRCASRSYSDRELIFREGSAGSELFIIVSGSVIVKKADRTIDIITTGECFGEMAAFSGERRFAGAEAEGKVVLLSIDANSLNTLELEIQVKILRNIVTIISERLRKRIEEKSH